MQASMGSGIEKRVSLGTRYSFGWSRCSRETESVPSRRERAASQRTGRKKRGKGGRGEEEEEVGGGAFSGSFFWLDIGAGVDGKGFGEAVRAHSKPGLSWPQSCFWKLF